jgi:hypothetical protein
MKMLPCPQCGGKPQMNRCPGKMYDMWWAVCRECDYAVDSDWMWHSRNAAVRAWNEEGR